MRNGVLDAKSYTRELERSWIFRTVGYGNDALVWKDIVTNLRLVGYDHVLSIEHEDSVMSGARGVEEGDRLPQGHRHRGAGRRGLLGVARGCRQIDLVASKRLPTQRRPWPAEARFREPENGLPLILSGCG